MKMLNNIWMLLILLTGSISGIAQQQTNAVARLDTNSITIGDQTGLEISFTCPDNYKVLWPELGDTLTNEIEIVEKSGIDSIMNENGNEKMFRQRLTITSFDSGYFAIPPVTVRYKAPGDTTIHTAETEAQLLQVNSVPVDLEQDIKDIKGPLAAPFTLREALPYILIFLAVAIVVFVVVYYIRKRRKAEPLFKAPPRPQLPPHRIALDAFENLRYKKLWQNGKIKQYHTELVDIIRDYLLGNFHIHAAEFTSDEIMEAVEKTQSNPQAKEKLRQTLILADLVKFAKMEPLPVEHDASLNNAIDFVKETMHLNNKPDLEMKSPEIKPETATSEIKKEPVTNGSDHSEKENNDGKEVKDV